MNRVCKNSLSGSVCMLLLSIGGFAMGGEDRIYNLSIESQPLKEALKDFAQQSGLQLVFYTDITVGINAPAVKGKLTTDEALRELLKDTNLTYRRINGDTVEVSEPGMKHNSDAASTEARPTIPSVDGSSGVAQGPGTPGDRLRLGQAQTSSSSQGRSESSPQNEPAELQEIIVTAQKRAERIQDVPVPVTALDAEKLTSSNQLRLQDYYNQVPGLTVAPASVAGYQLLSIRGISTGYANPTVGITVDDVPIGPSTVNGGNVPFDIDPGDLARIEVLRGPQGTLYGASSIGGLIKYVTVDPSTSALSGRVQAGASDVYNGAKAGYNVRGSINVPLSDTLAVRLSAFTREDPGYIDNPVLGIDGINKTVDYGGRVAAFWQPSEAFSLKLSALFQDNKAHGAADVDINSIAAAVGYPLPKLGDLQQDYIPGAGGFETKDQLDSAIVHVDLGGIDVTSITSYSVSDYFAITDYTWGYGPTTEFGVQGTTFHGFGVPGTTISTSSKGDKKVTEELRLSSSINNSLDWLVGGFYTYENSPFPSWLNVENPTTGEYVGLFGTYDIQSTFQEFAAFSDVTYHLTDRFNIQVGGRESKIRQTYQDTDTGDIVPAFEGMASPNAGPETDSKNGAFTYLLTPQFKLTPDVMTYIRLASGYRAGGPNVGFLVPPQYAPDKTYDYDLGIKGDVLAHRLSFDASVYYIDWKNIQVELANLLGTYYTGNAGGAKSQGVELSAELTPIKGLSIASWVAFNDAVLTKAFPPDAADIGTYGAPGSRLPYASRISGHASLNDEFPLVNSMIGSVGGEISYTGNRLGNLQGLTSAGTPSPRQELPGYAQINLRAGVKYQSWEANFFVNNVIDKRGVLDGGVGTNIPYAYLYIQPRTLGLNVVKSF